MASLGDQCLFLFQDFREQHVCDLVNALWDHQTISVHDLAGEEYSGFLRFVREELLKLKPHATKFAAQNWKEMIGIIQKLKGQRNLPRREVFESLKVDFPDAPDDAISRSTELAIRIWLGINVITPRLATGAQNPRDSNVYWPGNQSLDGMIDAQFPASQNYLPLHDIDNSFTAVNLKKFCGVKIRFTNNLKDHLRLEGRRGYRTLSIYQHKICLTSLRHATPSPMMNAEFLDETVRTLELLFPFGDAKTKSLLQKQHVSIYSVSASNFPRDHDLNSFEYWKNELAQLVDLFNRPPETVLQTLRDTRNLSRWATVWVAIFGILILTVIFGVLATIYSIKQYRIAVDSYNLSVKAFELSLLLACQQKTAPLPGFCD